MRSDSTSTLSSHSTPPLKSPVLPVLIAGAGLGGLALANSLSRSNIPFLVLERDSDLHGRAQGYRIAIDGGKGTGGADGLRAVLSAERFAFFERTCGAEEGVSGRVDAKSGKLEAKGVWGMISTGGLALIWALLSRVLGKRWDGGMGLWRFISGFWSATTATSSLKLPSGKSISYQIDRRVVRSILLGPSIAPHIKYSAGVTSYTLHPDSVEANLANGESIHGSLLVGADGIRSNVAAQLLASAHIAPERTQTLDLGVRVIYGKAPLTPELLEKINKGLHKGMAFIVDSVKLPPRERVMVVVKAMRFDQGITAEEKAKEGAEDVQTPEDYVFFAMVCRKEIWHDALSRMSLPDTDAGQETGEDVDSRLLHLSGQAAKDLSLFVANERSWDATTLALLQGQDPSQSAVLRSTSSDPSGPPVWESNDRVTVLGDAVHCMPPTGGQGGNMALWDGAILGQELAEEWTARGMDVTQGGDKGEGQGAGAGAGWKWSTETVRRYEDSISAYGRYCRDGVRGRYVPVWRRAGVAKISDAQLQ